MREETVEQILDRIHREVSPSMGMLCVALERRRVRASQLRSWAHDLTRGANDLLKLAERLEDRDAVHRSGHGDNRTLPRHRQTGGVGRSGEGAG